MTLPLTNGVGANSADIYTDFAGLTALKKSAHNNDPQALRQVAKQYESLFTRIMMKSMRDAVGKDPLFGSDQGETYQEMYDDQLAIELSKGKGLGLADLLIRQMQRLTGGGQTNVGGAQASSGTDASKGPQASRGSQSTSGAHTPNAAGPATSPAAQNDFITDLWPAAQQAGRQLGVDPRNLIAQAALETNWGTRVPRDKSGRSSNNLFGMKAGSQWNGASVAAATHEYENGTAVDKSGQFRAYGSREQSIQDYVSLLRSNPRYTAALNTGSNTHAFATALQRGGYATDPDYAGKIATIAATIQQRAAISEPSLKSASARPINPNAGTL